MKRYLKNHRKLLILNIIILSVITLFFIKFIIYMSNILDILYIQNSSLNKYYNDFYIANYLKPSDEVFIQTLYRKDKRLYQFFKDGKLQIQENQKGQKNFIWKFSKKTKKNIKLSDFFEQSFFKIFFYNENILIVFNNNTTDYQENIIYKYSNYSFIKTSPFNINKIQLEYAKKMNCKSYKIFTANTFEQSAYVLIQSGKVHLINSDFSADSQKNIKKLFEDIYKKEKDTFLINLWFYNLEDAICLE